jgi:hypothetical protein
MNGCLLSDLPEAILRLLVVEWVGLKEVTRLDTAFCNSELRKLFLTSAYNPITVFTSPTSYEWLHHVHLGAMLRWADLRKTRLDGIVVDDQFSRYRKLVFAYLRTSGSAINCITITSYDADDAVFRMKTLLKIAKLCPNVLKLAVQIGQIGAWTDLWDGRLIALTQSYPSLVDLTLLQVQLSKQGLATALKQCTHLQRLAIYTVDQVIPKAIAIPTLTSLECGFGCMTDAVLLAVGRRCVNLKSLTIFATQSFARTCRISGTALRAVLQGCPLLREIDVENAERMKTAQRIG